AVDGNGACSIVTDQRPLLTFKVGANSPLLRTGNIGRIGSPVNFQSVEIKVGLKPLGRIRYAVALFSAGRNAFQSARLYRPPYDIGDVTPEICKRSSGIVKEVPIGSVTAFRKVFRIRSRT